MRGSDRENLSNISTKRDQEKGKASFKDLFRYASLKDILLISLGTMSAMIMGGLQPIFVYSTGTLFGSIGANSSPDDFYNLTVNISRSMVYCGIIYITVSYIAVMCFIIVGTRQSFHFRKRYLAAVLKCDPFWFDKRPLGEISLSISSETLKIERAVGDKLILLIIACSTMISSICISLYVGTQLALICFCFGPFIAGGFMIANDGMEKTTQSNNQSYKKAGGIAEEALQEIKTVSVLNGQKYESFKYKEANRLAYSHMLKNGLKIGIGSGIALGSLLLSIATMFMVGAQFINENQDNWGNDDQLDIGSITIVMWSCWSLFNQMSNSVPSIKLIIEGRMAAFNILKVINEKSKIEQGKRQDLISGTIEFKNISFSYPREKKVSVLDDISFLVEAGAKLGIAGHTGSGKSTIVQLLLRYYEPTSGSILIDGIDIKEYSLSYLRENIGFVGQEPLLFNTTIYENIRYGKKTANRLEIKKAAVQSGAIDFIESFPDRFETIVGAKGSQLSGGQKQRLAIARAILRCPKIMILDEATSALDRQTEVSVVESLENALPKVTRITIAQNLLTLKESTKIIILDEKSLIECGSHEELLRAKGKYYYMVKMQKIDIKAMDEELERIITRKYTESYRTEATEDDFVDKKSLLNDILSLSSKEKWWLILGSFGAIIVGSSYSFVGMFTGKLTYILIRQDEKFLEDCETNAGFLYLVASLFMIGLLLESISFPRATSNITSRMRYASFKALLSYDAAFFDIKENNSSVLTSKLCNDCEKLNGLGGHIIGLVMSIFISLGICFGISASYSWRLCLVIIIIIPLMGFAVIAAFIAQGRGIVNLNYEESARFSTDAIMNYKTVKAFNLEDIMLERYLEPIVKESANVRKRAHLAGVVFGLGFGLYFLVYAFVYWYGAKLVKEGENTLEEMLVATFTAIAALDPIFIAGLYAPDIKNGLVSAKSIFKLLKYVPAICINEKTGIRDPIEGKIEFVDVYFTYPNRNLQALYNINFVLEPKTSLAIIGSTGAGKSTIIQLLVRLYDPTSGVILIDNQDIRNFNLKKLRRQIGLISQEPVLFSGTIKDNISYGTRATEEEIYEAANRAQALEFINKNPEGFDREVGIKGNLLSGGQKQRIAIARAIIRDAKILILDEATSALDSQTESKFLETMQDFMKERTCVIIAHRLKTISEADIVMVLDKGKVLEFGNRDELIAQKGYLYMMINAL